MDKNINSKFIVESVMRAMENGKKKKEKNKIVEHQSGISTHVVGCVP